VLLLWENFNDLLLWRGLIICAGLLLWFLLHGTLFFRATIHRAIFGKRFVLRLRLWEIVAGRVLVKGRLVSYTILLIRNHGYLSLSQLPILHLSLGHLSLGRLLSSLGFPCHLDDLMRVILLGTLLLLGSLVINHCRVFRGILVLVPIHWCLQRETLTASILLLVPGDLALALDHLSILFASILCLVPGDLNLALDHLTVHFSGFGLI